MIMQDLTPILVFIKFLPGRVAQCRLGVRRIRVRYF